MTRLLCLATFVVTLATPAVSHACHRWGYGYGYGYGWGMPAYGYGYGYGYGCGWDMPAYGYGCGWGVPAYSYGYGWDTYPCVAAAPSAAPAVAWQPAPVNTASIRVAVPANARVWVDGAATKQTGADRRFQSPSLAPGRNYSYRVTAQWRDADGRAVTRSRQVHVRANADVRVDFNTTQTADARDARQPGGR